MKKNPENSCKEVERGTCSSGEIVKGIKQKAMPLLGG